MNILIMYFQRGNIQVSMVEDNTIKNKKHVKNIRIIIYKKGDNTALRGSRHLDGIDNYATIKQTCRRFYKMMEYMHLEKQP